MGTNGKYNPDDLPRPPSRWAPRGLAAFAAVTLAGLFVPFGLLWAKTGTGSRWRPFGRRSTAPAPYDHSTTNWLPACLSPFLWFGAVSSFSGGKRARRQRCVVRTIALMLVPVLAVDPQMVWAVHAEALAYQALATTGIGVDRFGGPESVVTSTYDGNGNLIARHFVTGPVDLTQTYVFDAENRLVGFNPAPLASASPLDLVDYTYDFDGIRTSKATGGSITRYITDKNRDYAQVLEERNSASLETVRYVYGHDLISQTRDPHGPATTTHYFHYDGQLSTRMLTDGTTGSPAYGQVTDSYTYDAFGNELGSTGSTPNAYRYTGEQYDANLGFYYLRARYYDQATGRFASRDPYAGSAADPRSLHKYLYARADPVMAIDPTGLCTRQTFGVWATAAIGAMYQTAHPGNLVRIDKTIPGFASRIRPDIANYTLAEAAEIKPATPYGLATGHLQLLMYLGALNLATGRQWSASAWDPGVQLFFVPCPVHFGLTLTNAGGVIYYVRLRNPYSTAQKLLQHAREIVTLFSALLATRLAAGGAAALDALSTVGTAADLWSVRAGAQREARRIGFALGGIATLIASAVLVKSVYSCRLVAL